VPYRLVRQSAATSRHRRSLLDGPGTALIAVNPCTPVIMVAAFNDPGGAVSIMKQGAADVLFHASVTTEALRVNVREALWCARGVMNARRRHGAQEAFLQVAAQDLRASLTKIEGFIRLAQHKMADGARPKSRQFLQAAIDSTRYRSSGGGGRSFANRACRVATKPAGTRSPGARWSAWSRSTAWPR